MIQDASTSSGQLTAGTTAVYANDAVLFGIEMTPAAADCTLTVYDNASAASGTIVAQMLLKASTASQQISFAVGVFCNKGITAVVAGAGATAIVYFNPSR